METLKKYLLVNKITNILVVFPHPDDESFATGGLILQANRLKINVTLLCLTKGSSGDSNIEKGDKLGSIRENELIKASKLLNINKLIIKDLNDSNLSANEEILKNVIKAEIDILNPDLVVTYGPDGFTGHPDHIAVSKVITDLYKKSDFNLLYYAPSGITHFLNKNKAERNKLIPNLIQRNFFNISKANAFMLHKSQMSKRHLIYKVLAYIFLLFASECYHELKKTDIPVFEYYPFKIK